MLKGQEQQETGVSRQIWMAYAVLGLHAVLLVGIGFLVLLLKGVATYWPWLLGGAALLLLGSGWWLVRKIKQSRKDLQAILAKASEFDRPVEIQFLGGVASLRVGQPGNSGQQVLEGPQAQQPPLLEDQHSQQLQHLEELSRMLERGLIDEQEFAYWKKRLYSQMESGEQPPLTTS